MRYTKIIQETTMKCKVQLFVAGKVFDEIVHARDYQEAKTGCTCSQP